MIITCPECSSQFAVKAEVIGATGRKVRCAKCKHNWFQAPPTSEELPPPETIQEEPKHEPEENSALPAIINTKVPSAVKAIMLGAISAFILTIFIITSNSILPSMSFLYNIFGIYDAKGLALYDVKIEKTESGQYFDLNLSGKISNDSKENKHIPKIKIEILDKNRKKLSSIVLEDNEGIIKAGEKLEFENKIPHISKDSEIIVVDMGNKIDISGR